MAFKPYTAAEDRYILLNFMDMSTVEIAKNLGKSPDGIRNHMNMIGINKNKYYGRIRQHRVDPAIKAKAYELWVNGMKLFEITKELKKYPRQSIATWIKDIKGYRGINMGYITKQSKV